MIVLHAGNKHGFVPGGKLVFKAGSSDGDYHSEMNHQNFQRWLTEKLIPNIPENTVLVLDNASYHNVQMDRCLTMATRKADMQAWLDRHNITYRPAMVKVELLQLCKQNAKPVYVADDILKRHGHQCLRLPPYHAEFNPIELIWGNLKGKLHALLDIFFVHD